MPAGYQEMDVTEALAGGGLVLIAGSTSDAALHINQAGAELWIARAPAGAALTVPAAAHVHVFVVRGDATLADQRLVPGTAVRLTAAGARPSRPGRVAPRSWSGRPRSHPLQGCDGAAGASSTMNMRSST